MAPIDVDTLFVNLRSWIDPKDWYEHSASKDAEKMEPERLDNIKQMARWTESDLLQHALKVVEALDGLGPEVPKTSLSLPPELLGQTIDVAFELQRRYQDLREIQFAIYHPPPSGDAFSGIIEDGVVPSAGGNDGLGFISSTD